MTGRNQRLQTPNASLSLYSEQKAQTEFQPVFRKSGLRNGYPERQKLPIPLAAAF